MPGILNKHPENSWLIRVGPECHEYGDPYTWCCNIKDEGDGKCLVYGVVVSPTRNQAKWTLEVANSLGFRLIRWSRIKNGKEHITEYFRLRNSHEKF